MDLMSVQDQRRLVTQAKYFYNMPAHDQAAIRIARQRIQNNRKMSAEIHAALVVNGEL